MVAAVAIDTQASARAGNPGDLRRAFQQSDIPPVDAMAKFGFARGLLLRWLVQSSCCDLNSVEHMLSAFATYLSSDLSCKT